MPNPAKPAAASTATRAEQHLDEALQCGTVEMLGIPGAICPHRACRRHRRCGFILSTDRSPACLAHLMPEARAFHDRLLAAARTQVADLQNAVSAHIRATVADDPQMLAVSEIVRRVQPRGHWLHAALPFWGKFARSLQALKRGNGKDRGNGDV